MISGGVFYDKEMSNEMKMKAFSQKVHSSVLLLSKQTRKELAEDF